VCPLPHNRSESTRELQRNASIKAEAVTPKPGKQKERPPSLNNIDKNINDDW
jgi:hypothetical protein